jgi:predicted outer membrane repeat protein
MQRLFLVLALGTLAAFNAQANTYKVGVGASCTHNDIQAAINTANSQGGANTIIVTNTLSYITQVLTIGAGDLTIQGGYANCDSTTATGSTLISGQGGTLASVFNITGSGVKNFLNLSITRGDAVALGGRGGGIRYEGNGDLNLTNVVVDQSAALGGGGIYFMGTGTGGVTANLRLGTGVLVRLNTAVDFGGGIAITGNARLFMTGANTSIYSNSADAVGALGGGLAIFGQARADIYAPGFGAFGAIEDNEAAYGGGVSVKADSNGSPVLRTFTTDASKPTTIRGNRARNTGGGIYAKPFSNTAVINIARVCLHSSRISANRAQNGAAIYLDTDSTLINYTSGAGLSVNDANSNVCINNEPESISAFGAVDCTPGANGCNLIDNNVTINIATNTLTDGAVVLAQTNAYARMNRVIFTSNTAGRLLQLADGSADLSNCLATLNSVSGNLMDISSGSSAFKMENCTIANNAIPIGSRHIDRGGSGTLILKNNIFRQQGIANLIYGGDLSPANLDIVGNYGTNAGSNFPANGQNKSVAVRFVDEARGDFRQRIGSQAVDRLAPIVGDDRDLDNRPYDQFNNIYSATNTATPRDVGAYERQASDQWLINGNFDGDLNLWSSPPQPFTSYSPFTSSGSSGGSLLFTRLALVGATTTRFNAGAQCFNVPAPGIYSLSAAGRGTATNFSPGDQPVIRWRVRDAGSCAQAAPIDQEGDLFLPNRSAFGLVGTPAQITISPALWTPNTTIEVRLDVIPLLADGPINAGFDAVSMTGVSIDKVFADGFE